MFLKLLSVAVVPMNTFVNALSPKAKSIFLLGIIYLGFISLGLPDSILGVAWEPMRAELRAPIYYAGFVAMLLTACSAVSAFFSGAVLRRLGTGKLLAICGFMTGFGLLGYSLSPVFWLIMLCAVPLGLGQGAIDTGMNFYVAKNYSSRVMSWLHCCWGVGASAGPLIITIILARDLSWRYGYGIVAAVQLLLAGMFLLTLNIWQEKRADGKEEPREELRGKVCYDVRFWCCPVMFFLYCGIEFSMGLWGYQFLTRCLGFSPEPAGYAVTGYWGMLTFGRFVLGFVANRLGNVRQIRYSMILGGLGALLLMFSDNQIFAIIAFGVIGFAFATFYPAMMHAAPERFDDATAATVIGYQGGAGMLGAALVPVGFGYLAACTTFNLLPYLVGCFCLVLLLMQLKVDGLRPRRSKSPAL